MPLARLPKFLVIDPVSTVRIEMELERSPCELDVELQNPRTGRSFVLLIGQRGGPYLQRLRLSGRARIQFQPKTAGDYALILANPQKDPLVLRLRGRQRHVERRPRARGARKKVVARGRRSPAVTARSPTARSPTPRAGRARGLSREAGTARWT